jgi:hypothetical protein
MTKGRTWSIELECVGMQFRWKKTGRETLARAVPFKVDLEREPDNKHDENAIKVVIASDFKLTKLRGSQLGYLRKETAEQFAPRFDAGTIETAKVWVTDINVDHGNADLDCRFRDIDRKRSPKRRRTAEQVAGDEAHSPGSDSAGTKKRPTKAKKKVT